MLTLVKGMLYAICYVELSLSKSSPITISSIFQSLYTKISFEKELLSIEVRLQNDNDFRMFNCSPLIALTLINKIYN